MYYNTNKESGQTLKESNRKADSQEETILKYFEKFPTSLFTADLVAKGTGLNCPITSIRRSISNLKGEGKLVKTDIMALGSYGKLTHCYTLNKNFGQQVLF